MTNKPMLSVERELRTSVEQALLAMKRIYQAGYDGIIAAGGSCDQPGCMFENDPTVRELLAILDKEVGGGSHAPDSQGQPVAWVHPLYLEAGALGFEASVCRLSTLQVPLFTEPTAPVEIVMPELKGLTHKDWRDWTQEEIGYNKALGDVARLNGVTK